MDRIDYKLRDLIVGTHEFPQDPTDDDQRQEMVVELAELRIAFEATIEAGWARHTGDWDFGYTVKLRDGTEHFGYNHVATWWLTPAGKKKGHFTACVDYPEVLGLIVETDDRNEEILLEDLKAIHIEQL